MWKKLLSKQGSFKSHHSIMNWEYSNRLSSIGLTVKVESAKTLKIELINLSLGDSWGNMLSNPLVITIEKDLL